MTSTTPTPSTGRRLRLTAAAAAAAIAAVGQPSAEAKLLSPAGPWPAPVVGATNPLLGSPFIFNGGHASANTSLQVWLPYGRQRRSALTRTIGGRTVIRGRLRDRTSRHSISGATLQIAAQNVDGGDWYLTGIARTSRKGRFKAILPPGPTRRVGVLYWPFVTSPGPVYSKRLLVRASARVYLKTTTRGRSVLFRGRVSGGPIPAGGLLVAAQVRNGGSWISVRLVRSQLSGRFRARYRFKFRNRSFAVRASVPAQPGWPLYTGSSQVKRVRTR